MVLTPGYTFGDGRGYLVQVMGFEDQSEQRYLMARQPSGKLQYQFSMSDSAQICAVTSWFLTAGGQDRFWARNHRTQRDVLVRSDPQWTFTRDKARVRDGQFPVQGSRAGSEWASMVLADSPTGWWRLGEASGANTVTDMSGNGFHGVVNAGVTFGLGPLLAHDGNPSALGNGTTTRIDVPTYGVSSIGALTIEVLILSSAFTGQKTLLSATTFEYPVTGATSSMISDFIFGLNAFDWTPTSMSYDNPHHLAVVLHPNSPPLLYQDGRFLVGSWDPSPSFPVAVRSLRLLCGSSAGAATLPYGSRIADIVYYTSALPSERILQHWSAFQGLT